MQVSLVLYTLIYIVVHLCTSLCGPLYTHVHNCTSLCRCPWPSIPPCTKLYIDAIAAHLTPEIAANPHLNRIRDARLRTISHDPPSLAFVTMICDTIDLTTIHDSDTTVRFNYNCSRPFSVMTSLHTSASLPPASRRLCPSFLGTGAPLMLSATHHASSTAPPQCLPATVGDGLHVPAKTLAYLRPVLPTLFGTAQTRCDQ